MNTDQAPTDEYELNGNTDLLEAKIRWAQKTSENVEGWRYGTR